MEMLNLWVLLCCLFCSMDVFNVCGDVVLVGNNYTRSFEDIEANLAPSVKDAGECGVLHVAEPLDACSPLVNIFRETNTSKSPFVLIIRGKCSFEDKIRSAQTAGFKAAIVYNNEDGELISMTGNSAGIKIHALFVSKTAGDSLAQYAAATALDMELWIIPNFGNPTWSILTISFISLLAMLAVLATCFFVRRSHMRREHRQTPHLPEFHGLSRRLVKAMPSLIFTAVLEDNSTSSTCAICLEDYTLGERLRVLPCCHKFHAICVDAWLTSWRTFCPVCKRDARTSTDDPPATEATPFLATSPASIVSSSSIRLPFPSSPAMHIDGSSSHSSSILNAHSTSSSYHHGSLPSIHLFPHLSASRSSLDLRNTLSLRSDNPCLVSAHSLHHHSLSSLNSMYMSPHILNPLNASTCHVVFPNRRANSLYYSGSNARVSPFASAEALPGSEATITSQFGRVSES